jgi:hypothetical protein
MVIGVFTGISTKAAGIIGMGWVLVGLHIIMHVCFLGLDNLEGDGWLLLIG